MPVFDITPHLRELGRLRTGEQQEIKTKAGKTKTVPARLETWRLTTPFRNLADAAAKLYGGQVREWENAPTQTEQWEVTTETSELEVLVPPQDVDTSYELWSGGGRQRLCDGITEHLSDGPCLCDPSERACKPRTQLVVVMPQIPDLGQWRLVTQSVFAAMELPATMLLLRGVHERAVFAHATLAIDQRTSKTDGTRHFAVPVLRLDYSLAEAGLLSLKAADPRTGEILSLPSSSTASGDEGSPPAAAPARAAGDTSSAAAAGGSTSEPPEAPEPEPPSRASDDTATAAAEYGGSDDHPAPEVEDASSCSGEAAPASGRRATCLHTSGVRTLERDTGGRAEVCVDCGAALEVSR